jgi:ribonuclease BN (tRNA processing enzyme)
MKLTIIGSSDAFGSGGRLQTCFHAAHPGGQFLIDCGATSLVGLARQGIDPNEISTIFISHLHGDHFAGLVWWLIHAIHVAKRTAPLTITGPVGIEKRFIAAAEALFPNSTTTARAFDMQFVEYVERQPLEIGGVRVTPFLVSHPSGAPPYALRFELGGKILAFSGDTEWVESLIDASMGTDLFICECSAFEANARYHLNWRTIERNLDRIGAKHILLTHMGPETLANRHAIREQRVSLAEDGMVLDIG